MKKKQDTIFALSTSAGRSAIAVIRISGKDCYKIIKKISRSPPKKPNKAKVNKIFSEKNGTIDQSITTYFKPLKKEAHKLECGNTPRCNMSGLVTNKREFFLI